MGVDRRGGTPCPRPTQMEIEPMGRSIDRTGQRYGRLLVLGQAEPYISPKGRVDKQWLCRCECGNTTVVRGVNLHSGLTNSCGCYKKDRIRQTKVTHGKSGTPEHRAWKAIKARCYNQKSKFYYCYGGRGIRVASEWLNSFKQFYADMGPRPSSAHSIERRDVNGNYCARNCYWATSVEQARNKQTTHWVETPSGRVSMAEACETAGLLQGTVAMRIRRGWPEARWFDPVSVRGANLSG